MMTARPSSPPAAPARRPFLPVFLWAVALLLLASLAEAKLETRSYYSESLRRVATYSVYTPDKLKEGDRLPSLYVLHGAMGSYRDWPERTSITTLADRYRMVLVFPDGGEYGWYVDSPREPSSQYDTFVSKELVGVVDGHYPTITSRDARGIMGLSMGGHGALSLAAKHPDVFGSASSLSGILELTNHPESWRITSRLGPLAENRAAWEANSVYHLAERFASGNVRVLFDCGVDDTKTKAIEDNRRLHEHLVELRIPHIYRELPGTHAWKYWEEHAQDHLNFHQASVLAAMKDPEKWFAHYYKREVKFLDENAQVAIDQPTSPTLCLLGSSSMEGMPSDLFPGYRVYNRGISADRLGFGSRGISQRMEESVFDMKPDVVYFKNARNDLSARYSGKTGKPTDEEMLALSDKIVSEIRERLPNTLLIIGPAFPVRDGYAHLAPSIAVYAELQRGLAAKHGLPVADGHKALIGEDGLLKPEYSAEGLHLSKAGKAVVAGLIIDEIRKARPELAPKP